MTEPITPQWLTAVLSAAGVLTAGTVVDITNAPTDAFNAHTQHLRVRYAGAAPPELPTRMVLKRTIDTPWGREAGADKVRFYQLAREFAPYPPALVPCYTAAHDATHGTSYLLLQDLSDNPRATNHA